MSSPDSLVAAKIRARGYRLCKKINSGAQGTVFLAKDRIRGVKVAIKIMKRASRSTRRELFAFGSLSHDSLVSVVDVFHVGESSVLVMEYLPGGDLFDWMASTDPLDAESLYEVARRILRSLEYMHATGMAHRDLKLENIVLGRAKDATTLKIVDFGFATPARPGNMMSDDFSGTVSYQPPEQILKQPFSPIKGDMWSLGVLLYTFLFKKLPFGDSKDPRTQIRITSRRKAIEPRRCPGVSRRFLLLIQMLLDPVPESRPSATEALDLVESVLIAFHSTREAQPAPLPPRAATKDVCPGSPLSIEA
eukprot:CAMPEP_0185846680 /NCGR_PEP_ID=MMETSP1354-20130828/2232_1 /TAXON_ID=708628 /ORGANISM="Erythrolobus madagascarensis, Strain CCMP3276" /LENGTH=305 /DNA_ID=CAMNT_0028546863 /DNA_START=142 /DNA_END=1059 /DNA_ORIENTATION=+